MGDICADYWPTAMTDSRKWRFYAVKAASVLRSHTYNAAPCQNTRRVAEFSSAPPEDERKYHFTEND